MCTPAARSAGRRPTQAEVPAGIGTTSEPQSIRRRLTAGGRAAPPT
jgi:hypothetical protein